jgi:predicted RNase H-like HicB family nuclease
MRDRSAVTSGRSGDEAAPRHRTGSGALPRPPLASPTPQTATYKAVFERDDNDHWLVRAPEVLGAHSHGRTLTSARSNIREAIALVLDVDEGSFDIEETIVLPGPVSRKVLQAQRARAGAEAALTKSTSLTAEAVDTLSSPPLKLSLRDVADLLGVSFQRVQQLRQRRAPRESPEWI